jgi:hypothetical protein
LSALFSNFSEDSTLENNDKTAKRGVVFLNATCMFAARTPVARVAHVPRLMRVTR